MSQLSFQQRCASALTHPLTVSALAVLLLNDLLLKSLWPNPWTTGKLSDLAWVVFAPPLLAFLLSFVTRSRPLGERAAFAVAYIGLPLLYAAFNTFGWLHEWILSVLLLFTGSAVGSPLDPTDSIVIPFALALALWVWRQADAALVRHRMRLSLFAAVLASLATVATSPNPSPTLVQWHVGIGSDGRVVMEGTEPSDYYSSKDGGLTWAAVLQRRDADVQWGGRQVETPRGTYTIQESGITLLGANGELREVYSTAYHWEGVNQWAQEYATRKLRDDAISSYSYRDPRELVMTKPINLVYDSRTSNVVVSMGLQGVLVGDSSETWTRVGVGDFIPTDFSFSGKARLLLSLHFWFSALSYSILFLILAVALSERYSPPLSQWRERLTDSIKWAVGILLILLVVATALYSGSVWASAPALLLLGSPFLLVFALSMPREGLFRKTVAILFAVLGSVVSSLSFPPFSGKVDIIGGIELEQVFAISGLIFSIGALVLFLPRRRQLLAYSLALASMVASITFLGLMWLTGGLAGFLAFFAGVALLALIAALLFRHLTSINVAGPDLGQ